MKLKRKLFFESLGCPKNRVDSEIIIAGFIFNNWEITENPKLADLIMINTCGFVENAREESIGRFFELYSIKKKSAKIGLAGCLVQLYSDLKKMLPETDFLFGINDIADISNCVQKNFDKGFVTCHKNAEYLYDSTTKRVLTFSPYTAYVKIADGCENFCSYCSIPFIRGRYRERNGADIFNEVTNLVKNGVKEIVLISQDTTKYGITNGSSLTELLTLINSIKGDFKIRIMYLHPSGVDINLLTTIRDLKKVMNYLEIPLQHVSNNILDKMNRRYCFSDIKRLIHNINSVFKDDFVLRTTFISSFPCEKNSHHKELLEFIDEGLFDYAGVFKYSKENLTEAGKWRAVCKKVADLRFMELEKSAYQAMEKRLDRFVGKEIDVLYEGIDPELKVPVGRSWIQAPEIDGMTIITNINEELEGFYYKCKIIYREGVDFVAQILY